MPDEKESDARSDKMNNHGGLPDRRPSPDNRIIQGVHTVQESCSKQENGPKQATKKHDLPLQMRYPEQRATIRDGLEDWTKIKPNNQIQDNWEDIGENKDAIERDEEINHMLDKIEESFKPTIPILPTKFPRRCSKRKTQLDNNSIHHGK